jgi:hypothetical protein
VANYVLTLNTFHPEPSLRLAAEVLAEGGLEGALCGRLAVWHYVEDWQEQVQTEDVDIAIRWQDAAPVREILTARGFSPIDLPFGGVGVRSDDRMVALDFMHRRSERYGDLGGLFASALEARLGGVLRGGQFLDVVRPEHLVVMKFVTGRDTDRDDIVRILNATAVDMERTRELARLHAGPGGLSLFERFLFETGHPAAYERRFESKPWWRR